VGESWGEGTATTEPKITTQYGPRPDSPFGTGILFLKAKNTKNTDTVAYYHHDHLDTPIQATDRSGIVVWSAQYNVFGQATLTTPTATDDKPVIESNLRFPGQTEDAETGLYYNWHRYYDPALGRYVTADPIGLVGGVNLYAYVGGDPVNLSDPDGLCPMCVTAAQYLRCVANCMVDKGAGQAWEGKSLECINWEGNCAWRFLKPPQ
jgi:RHS repeat-associated protein